MWKKALAALAVVLPLLISLGLEREARVREQAAEKREAALLRVQNDQSELQGLRRRLLLAGRAQQVRLALNPWLERQRHLLLALQSRPWVVLEWEEAGFYVEGLGLEQLPWAGASREPGRLASHWK